MDYESIIGYKNDLLNRNGYESYSSLDINEFLKRIRVLSKDYENDGKWGITAGGLLFFGKNNAIIHAFPHFQLDYYDKSHPEKDRWTDRISSIESDLNIYTFFKTVEQKLYSTIENPFTIDKESAQRIDHKTPMTIALREGLINMLMHTDYFGDLPLIVNNYLNYYEFANPGKMKVPPQIFSTPMTQ
ncbi:hypothetical protein [Xylocopilactobacillus apicola]|uniref:Uncharacterized protein n=1 Tax=Xylocopilactobacillus apicola TaxID=2932184 RepID=A0AAU9DV69_9LACO|nr:hypothetical protein [Xylocopilactobacillus apicola]BDR57768.1 hypothetical protein XA3_02090 [Xylocopilactobacillus apicola]